jgi:hypothetical protein
LEKLKSSGKYNYGLLLGKGDPEDHGLLVVPVYRTDCVIATIQFRSFSGLIRGLQERFQTTPRQLSAAVPAPFPFALGMMGSGGGRI